MVTQPGFSAYCCIIEQMKLVDVRATTVTIPLEAPLRHPNGCHWGRFVRTIVEVETDDGLIGLGEMGGGGESTLDRDKVEEYSEMYQRLGGYPYDQDPGRPGWAPIVPNDRWADPRDDRPVSVPN